MGKKISDKQLKQYLSGLEKETLVDWLVDECRYNDELRSGLLDLATPKEEAGSLITEVQKRITKAWSLAKGRDGWKKSMPISRELSLVLDSIESLMEKKCHVEAEKVLAKFIQAADKGMLHVDDSYGVVWPECQRAVLLWGKVWSQLPKDEIKLAELVNKHLHTNDTCLKDNIITDFAEALGERGLQYLKDKLLQEYYAAENDMQRRGISGWLEDIADALGDVEGYIQIQQWNDRERQWAIPIARRLLETGEPEKALEYLQQGDTRHEHFHGEPYDYTTLHTKILLALEKDKEAREVYWKRFMQTLSEDALEKALELTPGTERAELRTKAINQAMCFGHIERALSFLVKLDELEKASELIKQKGEQIHGGWYDVLPRIAKAMAGSYPADAWVIYRALVLNILDEARYKAYGFAARYLNTMDGLSQKAAIGGQHTELVNHLKQKHGKKRSFWAKVDKYQTTS